MPAARALGGKKYKVETHPYCIEWEGSQLYGELLTPTGKSGKLPMVICCHGYGSNYKNSKRLIGKSLAMSGYAVYCFDFYGGSKRSKSGGSMMEMSVMTEKSQLIKVIDHIKRLDITDTDNLFLLGESQGGMVSAITAVDRVDDLKAMILYYPAFCIPDDAHQKFQSKDDIPEVTEAFHLPISRKYYADVWDLDVFALIQSFDKPILILHGDKDEMVNVRYGKKAAEVYPDAVLEILPGEIHGFYGKGKLAAMKSSYRFLEANRSKTD
jgi:dienelactone hydrolase